MDPKAYPALTIEPDHSLGALHNLMVDLACRPNVHCKLSSVITQADWQLWSDTDIFPFLDVACEALGTSRIIVGSDWLVSTCAADYATTMGLFERWSKKLSPSEQVAFVGGNCARFHGIEE